MKRSIYLALSFAFIAYCFSGILWAEDEEKPFIEEEKRTQLEETIKVEPKIDNKFLYDYGAWWRSATYTFDDQGDKHILRTNDFRFWGKALLNETHNFYVRIKAIAVDYNEGDGYLGDDNYWIKPRLDQGFYTLNLSDALLGKEESRIFYPRTKLQIGRQYLSLGSGLAYSQVNDSLKLDMHWIGFDSTILMAQTIPSVRDIDISRPDHHGRRDFMGLQVTLQALDRHVPYVFALKQTDNNREDPADATQNYDYNSNYYGLGVRGTIIPKFEYAAEYIQEKGKSYANGSATVKEDIKASAKLFHVRYLPSMKYSPFLTARYISGSGDKDRLSVTNTVGGNKLGTNDTNFLSFGYAMTGYVLNPRISNLNVTNILASIKPVQNKEWANNTEVGVGLYWYTKDKKEGGISDRAALLSKKDVGNEVDFFADWKVFYDLSVSIRSGIFTPGSAYPDGLDDKSKFYSLSFNYSF